MVSRQTHPAVRGGTPWKSPWPTIRALLVRGTAAVGLVGLAFAVHLRMMARFGSPFWAFTLSIAVPLLVLLGVWLVRWGRRSTLDARAVAALENGEPPQEEEWAAVAGTAHPVDQPFASILTGKPAVATSYRVREEYRRHRGETGSSSKPGYVLRYEGYHMAPTVIETPDGPVRLRGFPDLSELHEIAPTSGTPFDVDDVAVRSPRFLPAFAARAQLLSEPIDELTVDWEHCPIENPDLIQRREWVLAPGEQVCVLGRWRRGSLVPSHGRPRGLPVHAGTASQVHAKLREEAGGLDKLGAILLVVALALGLLSFL